MWCPVCLCVAVIKFWQQQHRKKGIYFMWQLSGCFPSWREVRAGTSLSRDRGGTLLTGWLPLAFWATYMIQDYLWGGWGGPTHTGLGTLMSINSQGNPSTDKPTGQMEIIPQLWSFRKRKATFIHLRQEGNNRTEKGFGPSPSGEPISSLQWLTEARLSQRQSYCLEVPLSNVLAATP